MNGIIEFNKNFFNKVVEFSKKIKLKRIATVGLIATGLGALVIAHNKPVSSDFKMDTKSMDSFEKQFENDKDIDITMYQDDENVLRSFNDALAIYDEFINDDNESLAEYARVKLIKAGFDLEKVVKNNSKKMIRNNNDNMLFKQVDLDYVISFENGSQSIGANKMPSELQNIIKLCFEIEAYQGDGTNEKAWMKKDFLGKTEVQSFRDKAVRLYNDYLEMKENNYELDNGNIIKTEIKKSY